MMNVALGTSKTIDAGMPLEWSVVEDWIATISPSADKKSCSVTMIAEGSTEVVGLDDKGEEVLRIRFDVYPVEEKPRVRIK